MKLYYGDITDPDRQEIIPPRKEKRHAHTKVRGVKQREELVSRLLVWRTEAHTNDSLLAVRPLSHILNKKGIKMVMTIHPSEICDANRIVEALDETEEWSNEWSEIILNIIQTYDKEKQDTKKKAADSNKARKNDRKLKWTEPCLNKNRIKCGKRQNSTFEHLSYRDRLGLQTQILICLVTAHETKKKIRILTPLIQNIVNDAILLTDYLESNAHCRLGLNELVIYSRVEGCRLRNCLEVLGHKVDH